MIAGEQTVVVPGRTARVTAICQACLEEQPDRLESYLSATVEASLPLEHDHGSAICSRGHEIRFVRTRRAESPHAA